MSYNGRGLVPQQFRRYVIRPTLRHLGEHSAGAEELLFATVAHESLGGRLMKQLGGNAVSAFQIEPNTHKDLWINYIPYQRGLENKLRMLSANVKSDEELITNLKYACAIAYLVYRRAKDDMPDDPKDIWALAAYWKLYYNTYKGAGTLRRFVADYRRWV